MLERDGAVDLLASAISIVPEREKNYGLLFTGPTLLFPQTMMGFAVRKPDRVLLQELNQQLAATVSGRDGVLSKSIPGWNN